MPRRTRGQDADTVPQSMHGHELVHQKHIHQTELIAKDEDTRRLRVRKHFLTDDVDSLHCQISSQSTRLNELSVELDKARAEADSAREAYRIQEKHLKTQARDLGRLKAEFDSLSGVSQESAKLLEEKLALSREVNTMKPELEHLRSQLAHHQTTISEKLSLERQLSMAEVDLAAERRARQQAADREREAKVSEEELQRKLQQAEKRLDVEIQDKKRLLEEAESNRLVSEGTGKDNEAARQGLKKRMEATEAKLALEKREKDRIKKDGEAATSEAQAKMDMMEQRLDTLKSKLQMTQGELKACRTDLEQAQQAALIAPSATTRPADSKTQANKKRRVHDVSTGDITMATLDDEDVSEARRLAKKRVPEHTLVGEKSTFSVTPFLNRNKTLSMEALLEQSGDENEADNTHMPGNASRSDEVRDQTMEPGGGILGGAIQAANGTTKARSASKEGVKKAGRPRGRPKKPLAETSSNILQAGHLAADQVDATTSVITGEAADVTRTTDSAGVVKGATVGATSAPSGNDRASQGKATDARSSSSIGCNNQPVREPEVKKKRRRLAGDSSKTIFNEQDADAQVRRPAKGQPGASRVMGKQKTVGVRNVFASASFSPLKKDRRGVQTSFLA